MGGDNKARYVVDASSWILIEDHPAQNRILSLLGNLIDEGRICCPPEAWEEVRQCTEDGGRFARYRDQCVKNIVDASYHLEVGKVAYAYPAMSGTRGNKNKGDPYVVAMAAYLNTAGNPTVHVVVSEESNLYRPNRKIGKACADRGIQHMSLWQMLRKEFPGEDL